MKSVVIYFSSTGNTEMMAKEIADAAGIEMVDVSEITAQEALAYDALILGCSAMGDEELDSADMEPFFADLESAGLSGKKVALFGSYDWGDGEWMRLWYDRCVKAGAEMIQEEGLIANLEPDDDALAACRDLAAKL